MLFRQQFKFFTLEILRNKFSIAVTALLLVAATLIPLLLFPTFVNSETQFGISQINANSILYFMLPICLICIFMLLATYIVFGVSKNNNVDLHNNVRPIKRWKIAFAKELSMVSLSFVLNLTIHVIVLLVIYLSVKNMSLVDTTSFVGISFFGSTVSLIIFGAVFVAMATYLKSLSALIANMLILFISIGALIGPRFISSGDSVSLSYKKDDQKQNYVKLYEFNDDGIVNNVEYAQQTNWDSTTKDNSKEKSIEKKIRAYNPLNFITTIDESLWVTSVQKNIENSQIIELFNNKTPTTIIEPEVQKMPLVVRSASGLPSNFVAASIDGQTLFDISDNEKRFEKIYEILNREKYLSNNIDDESKWKILHDKLTKSSIWLNINLSNDEKEFIAYVAGLRESSKMLFDILANNFYVQKYVVGLDGYLGSKGFGDELVNLLKFIWNDPISSSNLLGKSLDFIDIDEVFASHPQLFTMDEKSKAIFYDIDFIKNREFRFEKNNGSVNIKVLNGDDTYVSIPNFSTIFPGVSSKEDFDKFIDNSSTIVELKTLIDKTQKQLSSEQVKKFNFHNNTPDLMALNYWLNFSVKKFDYVQLSYLSLFLTVAITMNIHAFDRLGRKDLI